MSDKVTLEIDAWPGFALSPNARIHWAMKYVSARAFRELTGWLAIEARIPHFEKVAIQITYIVPDRRRRDPDNFLTMFKPGIDGLVDAKVLKDDSAEYLTILPVQFEYQKGQKKVRVEIIPQ